METKENVVLYTVYDEADLDYSYKKEEKLKEYCGEKGYEIVRVFRGGASHCFADIVNAIMSIVYRYRYYDFETKELNFTKLVCFDLKEICVDNEEIVTLGTIVKENCIEFETIRQGNIGSNLVYSVAIKEDVKKEVKKNIKFVVDDTPF